MPLGDKGSGTWRSRGGGGKAGPQRGVNVRIVEQKEGEGRGTAELVWRSIVLVLISARRKGKWARRGKRLRCAHM